MLLLDRRFDHRVPLEMYLNAYVNDERQRGFTVNISESGLYISSLMQNPLPPLTPLGLEFSLPGLPETIWAAGEMCYDDADGYFYHRGIRFVAMANAHARLLREYCFRARRRNLLAARRPLA